MITVNEVIIVEGKYDKAAIERVCSSPVFTTEGFRIFSDRQKVRFLREMAKKRGLLVLTDSDRAGFMIRNRIKAVVKEGVVRHAYIPEVFGKERRKKAPSKEGKIGVEGFDDAALVAVLEKYATPRREDEAEITKKDLYACGLYGGANCAAVRSELCKKLGIPQAISVNALVQALSVLLTKDELYDFAGRFQCTTDTD